ncbi:VanZ family protein [Clostridium celatum]|mgnify:CR=1 FL=1|uniref:VanZ-like protein n=1 Tax=Clostridium celatum DSM 1785 TaxID=545697 RepID=L1QGJ6_9CLOT|nr:VanZ family protein [Clostridium celatum]EKY27134.1 VanZ-like protein [Clostridium celatum DSM 1785]MCE9656803.1 VanZ family protein [Clostridium celatum]MDU2266857.1 VanZ family protein [Clostridium celatum]MDU3723775.1 VanZ family protein [Clostridium celatum]MDU6297381.1 VanZ family protein [Clostridium celatum]
MKNKRIIINWILLILWIIIIFFMSHQPAEVSNQQSDLIIQIFNKIGLDLNSYLGSLATFIIRKTAHFTEYFILYILANNVLRYYFSDKKKRIYILIFVLIYAISDEVHQYFVPGRAMALRDVLIDFSGGFTACLVEIIYKYIKK